MADVEEMETECDESEEKDDGYTMKQLLKTKELHVPLIIACMLQVVQQLSGINAVSGQLHTSRHPCEITAMFCIIRIVKILKYNSPYLIKNHNFLETF